MKYKLIISLEKFLEVLHDFGNQFSNLSELLPQDVPLAMNNTADSVSEFIKESVVPHPLQLNRLVKSLYWQKESFKHSFFLNSEQENLEHNLREVKTNLTRLLGYLKMIRSLEDDEELEIETISEKMDFILTQLNKSFDDYYYSITMILELNQILFREGEPEELVEDLKRRGYVIPIEQYLSTDQAKLSVKGANYIERKNKTRNFQKATPTPVVRDSSARLEELEYFELSNSAKIPARCPILNYCARRAYTIYFYSEYSSEARGRNVYETLKDSGELPDDFKKKMIPIQGETVSWGKSENLIHYNNACPEVNLFDSGNALPFAYKTASTSGDWDNFRQKDKYKSGSYRHYSQCGEYSSYVFEKTILKKGRKRSPISSALRFEIFQRDNFTCQYCGRNKDHKAVLVIDHVIPYSDGGKDEYSNLITSCQDCNSGKSNKVI